MRHKAICCDKCKKELGDHNMPVWQYTNDDAQIEFCCKDCGLDEWEISEAQVEGLTEQLSYCLKHIPFNDAVLAMHKLNTVILEKIKDKK